MSQQKSKNITEKLFTPLIINIKESVSSCDLDKDVNDVLTKKIRKKLGNKCSKFGYVKQESINILERSIGRINSSHFSGSVIFDLKLEIQVCNPKEGDTLIAKVIGKNKMGILAENRPIIIALSKLHHSDPQIFNSITTNQLVKVVVIDSKFELNDTEIHVIARLEGH